MKAMKAIILLMISLCIGYGQAAGVGTVVITPGFPQITATAGVAGPTQIICVGTAGTAVGASTMQMYCTIGGVPVLPPTTFSVPSTGGAALVWGVNAGTNAITWILTKGNAVKDSWSVTSNGNPAAAGTF